MNYYYSTEQTEKKGKFKLCSFDPAKMTFQSFSTKILIALMEHDMAYLLTEASTTTANAKHSRKLALELFDKVEGAAKLPFSSLEAQKDLLMQGRGIEMLRILAAKFGSLSMETVRKYQLEMQSLELKDNQELTEYTNKLLDINSKA
jgi:hypothetical protein